MKETMLMEEQNQNSQAPAAAEVLLPYTLRELSGFGLDLGATSEKALLSDLITLLAHNAISIHPEIPAAECRAMFCLALQEAAAKHRDLPQYLEGMIIACLGLLPYAYRISWSEFVEAVYCVAKYSDFMQPTRLRSFLNNDPKTGAYVQ